MTVIAIFPGTFLFFNIEIQHNLNKHAYCQDHKNLYLQNCNYSGNENNLFYYREVERCSEQTSLVIDL